MYLYHEEEELEYNDSYDFEPSDYNPYKKGPKQETKSEEKYWPQYFDD